jgi:hypothetical protein
MSDAPLKLSLDRHAGLLRLRLAGRRRTSSMRR